MSENHQYEVVSRSYGVAVYSPTKYRLGGFETVAEAKAAVLKADPQAEFWGDKE